MNKLKEIMIIDKDLIKDKIIELYKAVATKGPNCSFKEKHQAEILEWVLAMGENNNNE